MLMLFFFSYQILTIWIFFYIFAIRKVFDVDVQGTKQIHKSGTRLLFIGSIWDDFRMKGGIGQCRINIL